MRAWALLTWWVVGSGCVGLWRRAEVESRLVREHYAVTFVRTDLQSFERLWNSLDWSAPMGCLSLVQPCRITPQNDPLRCFQWGVEDACFVVTEGADGLRVARSEGKPAAATERWLYEQLDPAFAETRETAEFIADAEVGADEMPPPNANSFWATTRAAVQVPQWSVGQHVQGGWRRWLEHSLLLNLGGGYERTYTTPTELIPRDAVLLTARLELSSFDALAPRRAFLPLVSAYFGITGVLGVSPAPSWTTRAYVGVSAIVPVSFELGYALASSPRGSVGQFYVAAGLGL